MIHDHQLSSDPPLPAAVAVPFTHPDPTINNSINNDLDDVFGSSPDDADRERFPGEPETHGSTEISDIPRLRSVHVTAGYREGIAESKGKHVQDGFDEGYSLGAFIGMRVGWILGVLGGIAAALKDSGKPAISSESPEKTVQTDPVTDAGSDPGGKKPLDSTEARALLSSAKEELTVQNVFGNTYFDEEGIWKYGVTVPEDETTFEQVAEAHPLISRWEAVVENLGKDCGLDLRGLALGTEGGQEE